MITVHKGVVVLRMEIDERCGGMAAPGPERASGRRQKPTAQHHSLVAHDQQSAADVAVFESEGCWTCRKCEKTQLLTNVRCV
ncbi:hypothetical protein Y032_0008g152 [Ancylostoma ceylanicum]|uniref:Uncharacterized protein n=1 Tax=Ancylostoma ceylanicum TaxID=53326 RepID=A0A016VJE5_9BILA|nr:hypothetical protein Y032_0008g152 [Ancylostoma ceylanicum]